MRDHSNYFSSDQDPYRNPETGVLNNIQDLQTEAELEKYEELMFQVNSIEAAQYLKTRKDMGLAEWKAVHKMCFCDVFSWAGDLRSIRISKGSTVFAYPENIETESDRIFIELNEQVNTSRLTIDSAAELFAEVNVLHPFREGNGRTQRILFSEILCRINIRIDYTLTSQEEMILAMIEGYQTRYTPVKNLFHRITFLKE